MIYTDFRKEIVIRLLTPLLLLTITLVRCVQGQSTAVSEASNASQASQADTQPAIRFSLETNSRFGNFAYVPERWCELHLHLENSGNEPRNLLCTTYFEERPTLQFGRQMWVPARAKLNLSHPVLVPAADKLKNQAARIQSLVIDGTGGAEVLIKSESGQFKHDRSLLITPTDRNTGVLAGWNTEEMVPQDVLDLLVACRSNQGLKSKVHVLGGQFLPSDETYLQHLDHIVIAENRIIEDAAGLTALRRWLHAGGRLWVMLDKADPKILEALMGDDFAGHLVDRVELNSVRIDSAPTLVSPNGIPGEIAEYEEPVRMARVIASRIKVWSSVNEWPAAMTCSFGEGRVLITTLGPRAWIKRPPEPKMDAKGKIIPTPWGLDTPFLPNSIMEDLAAFVLRKREPDVIPLTSLESIAREHVAYKVPTWNLIVGTLACFLVLLLSIAVVLRRLDCLEHFGWSGSLLATVFGVVLTGIGLSTRYGVPGTMASAQIVQAIEGTDDVRTHGSTAIYRPDEAASPIQATHGGAIWPDLSGTEGSTRRMITTDLGTSYWAGLPQLPGLHTHVSSTSAAFVDRIEASVSLDGQKIFGHLDGHPATQTDALLATRNGRIGVTLGADGSITARADNVLEADQYVDTTFVGDEQDRHRRMFQELFANQAWKEFLDRPRLLVWVNNWSPGFEFGEGLVKQGDTLLAIPVELTRNRSDNEFLIPSPLISYSTRHPPDGSLPAGFWDDNRKEWQERSSPSVTWLNFQIPRKLLPLKATKARLQAKVSGPIGRLEILGVANESPVSLETMIDPVGSLSFDITNPSVLQVSDRGELSLGIKAGDPDRSGSSNSGVGSKATYWRIHSLNLQIWAKPVEQATGE